MVRSPTERAPGKAREPLTPRAVRMPPDVYEAVQRAAVAEDRTITSLIIRILRTWLVQRGYLPKPTGQTKPAPRRPKV
jgi:hypothetical protein